VSRWRPPAEASTALITRAGFECLREELDALWRVQRPEVVRALSAAAAEGDRSENAEYLYRKKQLGEIDRRLRYLSRRLEQLRVVDVLPSSTDRIYFGAEIVLEDLESGTEYRYRIVGPDETDARAGWISIDSPLARAMLGKPANEEIRAELPAGSRHLLIVEIDYSLLRG
jgi:transcription elongation factor GreB